MRSNGSDRPKLVVEGATKFYDTKSGPLHALDSFSIDVREGEFVCVVGPSGCGKTTLLWSMAGLHSLSAGRVSLDGEVVKGPHPQIGMVFQEANLLPWRSLIRNIQLPFEIKRKKPDSTWIAHLLDRVGLAGFEHKFPRELSGGMQQRASIVRALSFDPSVLLMDEPFGALDAFTRDEMNMMVEQIWLETRKTIVFITHNIAEAVFLSDRIFVMSARPGRLARTFEVPYARPRTLDVMAERDFFEMVNEIKTEIHHSMPTPTAGAAAPRAGQQVPAHG
jgi:NitT/TauT family transport system ATP-binding protein